LTLLDQARSRGVDVTCDTFPLAQKKVLKKYAWGSTALSALLPTWAFVGGPEALRKRLQSRRDRARMRKSDRSQARLAVAGHWDRIMLESAGQSPEFACQTFDKIARRMDKDPWDAVFDIILREKTYNGALMGIAAYDMEGGRAVLSHPASSVISDGVAIAPTGALSEVRFQGLQSYGYIPLLFEKFVREEALLTLEDAVRKCTSLPASRLGLKDRGVIREDAWADIVIFDPDRITCNATFEEPRQFPDGINHVFVNGEAVVRENHQTDSLPGMPLLRSG
jgi:N-acyl-D-aspartate/D-glutamate deacylase